MKNFLFAALLTTLAPSVGLAQDQSDFEPLEIQEAPDLVKTAAFQENEQSRDSGSHHTDEERKKCGKTGGK